MDPELLLLLKEMPFIPSVYMVSRTFDAILDDLGRNCLDKTDRDVSM